jgi:hypothetical protein
LTPEKVQQYSQPGAVEKLFKESTSKLSGLIQAEKTPTVEFAKINVDN